MQIEIAIVAIIIFYIMTKSGKISISKLVADNEIYLRKLKESDYDFYVRAKYGDSVNADILFNKKNSKYFNSNACNILFIVKEYVLCLFLSLFSCRFCLL